jgi:hypothetical protein
MLITHISFEDICKKQEPWHYNRIQVITLQKDYVSAADSPVSGACRNTYYVRFFRWHYSPHLSLVLLCI